MQKYLLLPFVLFGLLGCTTIESHLNSWNGDAAGERRVFEVKPVWVHSTLEQQNLGFRKINRMTPLLAGDLVIDGNGLDGISAFDRDSGRLKWRTPITNGVEGSATRIRDRIFFGASDGNFYSASASTGEIQWSFPTKAENLSEPLLNEGVVYFLAGNNVLFALDAATGRQLWLYSRQDTSQISVRGGSQPLLKDGILYVGFSDGSLVALNAASGNVQWELQLNRNKRFRDVDANPVMIDGQIYVGGYDDKLYCISAAKGEILWRVDGGTDSAVTVLGDRLFYAVSTGEVWALNKSNGSKIWAYKLKEGIPTQVRLFKGVLVFGESQGQLRFLDPSTGTLLGSFDPGRGILSTPQVDDAHNRVYFISGEANLYAIEAGWTRPSHFVQ